MPILETHLSNGAVIRHQERTSGGDITLVLRRIASGATREEAVQGTVVHQCTASQWVRGIGPFDETICAVQTRPMPRQKMPTSQTCGRKEHGTCRVQAWHSTIRNHLASGYVWEDGADPYYQILTKRDEAGFVVDELHVPGPVLASFRRAVAEN